jgi:hypothetical protein
MYIASNVPNDVTVDQLPELEWTTETPKKPGIYWAKQRDGDIEIIDIDSWSKSAFRTGQNGSVLKTNYTHWLGPIPAPEPPTE